MDCFLFYVENKSCPMEYYYRIISIRMPQSGCELMVLSEKVIEIENHNQIELRR